MLDEYKQIYYDSAEAVSGWKKMSRNELCNLYLKYKEENNPLYENCLSGIIYKFWNVATHNYYTQKIKTATPEDCYDWMLNGIIYALEHHVWTDPNSTLYGDENAPEKAINVKIYSEKINFYVAQTRNKRKTVMSSVSLEELQEYTSDDYFLPTYDNYKIDSSYLVSEIYKSYSRGEFLRAFMLDAIMYENLVDKTTVDGVEYSQFSPKKLKKFLKNYSEKECENFSYQYGYPIQHVKDSADFMKTQLSDKSIKKFLNELATYATYKKFRKDINEF